MPNFFSGLGYTLSGMNRNPLLAADAISQVLAGATGGSSRGGYGSGRGYGSGDPTGEMAIMQALNTGEPVSQVARTPEAGILQYALSRLGILGPNVKLSPFQMAEEQMALRGQKQQQAGQIGQVFGEATDIAAKGAPELAEQYYKQVQPYFPQTGNLPPDTFKNIYSRASIAQRAELEKERSNQALEAYRAETERINSRRADIAEEHNRIYEQISMASNARQAAALQVQLGRLANEDKRLQQSADKERSDVGVKLLSSILNSGSLSEKQKQAITEMGLKQLGINIPPDPTTSAGGDNWLSRAFGFGGGSNGSTPAPKASVKVPYK